MAVDEDAWSVDAGCNPATLRDGRNFEWRQMRTRKPLYSAAEPPGDDQTQEDACPTSDSGQRSMFTAYYRLSVHRVRCGSRL